MEWLFSKIGGHGCAPINYRVWIQLRSCDSGRTGKGFGGFNGVPQLRGLLRDGIVIRAEIIERDPKLRDVRYVPDPDPRPKAISLALKADRDEEPNGRVSGQREGPEGRGNEGPEAGEPKVPNYIGAFGEDEKWLEEWTFFSPESDYDMRDGGKGAFRTAVTAPACGIPPLQSRHKSFLARASPSVPFCAALPRCWLGPVAVRTNPAATG